MPSFHFFFLSGLAICGLVSRTCAGQNLIVNGDFEQQHACPQYVGDIEFARGWHNGNENTPDLFSRCTKGQDNGLHVPDNYLGTRQPVSGDAYAGLDLFEDCRQGISLQRNYEREEWIWTALTAPLQPGQTYQLRMWVSLADSAQYFTPYLTAVLSLTAFDAVHGKEKGQALRLPIAPQVANQTWQQVVVTFQPVGIWRYVSFGLARSVFTRREYQQALLQQKTALSVRNQQACYYYVDDITLTRVK